MEEVSSLSEQLEEGEIVDDDDFEDISDNPIIESTFGKFVSPNENLRALSLSSCSDVVKMCNKQVVKRRKKIRKSRTKPLKKRKRCTKILSDSSDSDVSAACTDLKDKLKEAVHINGVDEGEKKPLETRLKAMWGVVDTTAPDLGNQSSDKTDDHELETLRIEALKTAVINKFQRRKRKKAIMKEHEAALEVKTLENKENDTPKADNPVNDVAQSPNLDPEEDEDILRASLLAGLAKKITKIEATVPNLVAPPNKLATVPARKKILPKPQVKPLIINVNQDSDSDEDQAKPKHEPLSRVSDPNVISSSVDRFLKEQRAKFETETKKRFQIVHNKSKSTKSILEKSAVKLLPKSQQIEYQQLVKKLKIAERRKKMTLKKAQVEEVKMQQQVVKDPPKKVEVRTNNKVEICVNSSVRECVTTTLGATTKQKEVVKKSQVEVIVKKPIADVKSLSEEGEESIHKKINQDRRKSGITNQLTILQKTLKEIKMQRNGSLQIKSKYQMLTPIIRKITATSNQRKKQEERIRHLLQDLNEARSNLAQSHQQFSSLVRELVDTKGQIDNSREDSKMSEKKLNSVCTNKSKKDSANDVPQTSKTSDVERGPIPVRSTTSINQEEGGVTFTEEPTVTAYVSNDSEDMDVCSNNSDEKDCQIDIVDPNDIDQIFTRKSLDKLSIPEYVSPLNLNTYDRYRHVDPHGIMCPYEVNGSCRDVDCTFKHYLKKN